MDIPSRSCGDRLVALDDEEARLTRLRLSRGDARESSLPLVDLDTTRTTVPMVGPRARAASRAFLEWLRLERDWANSRGRCEAEFGRSLRVVGLARSSGELSILLHNLLKGTSGELADELVEVSGAYFENKF